MRVKHNIVNGTLEDTRFGYRFLKSFIGGILGFALSALALHLWNHRLIVTINPGDVIKQEEYAFDTYYVAQEYVKIHANDISPNGFSRISFEAREIFDISPTIPGYLSRLSNSESMNWNWNTKSMRIISHYRWHH